MTVTYTGDVGNATVRAFCRLLWRWKGSIWKAVHIELIAWLVAYSILALSYYHILNENQKRVFENLCVFFMKYADFVPITFILGFFVSLVISRWWSMFENLGWIDISAMYVAHHIHGDDEHGRLLRRNVIRHLLFYQVLVYRDISVCIRERFPTLESCVDAGYLTLDEMSAFMRINSRFPQYWTPVNWIMACLRKALEEGRIRSDKEIEDLQRRVMDFRNNLGSLIGYDWAPIPLLYSQVVSLSVRLYFIMALLSRQNLENAVEASYLPPINIYVPIVSIMQFVFFVGWLKVAEALLNPFGGDDDDFEINWLLDRNLEEREAMPLVKDNFWSSEVIYPFYSEATVNRINNPMVGSAVTSMKCQPADSVLMLPRTTNDEDELMKGGPGTHSNTGAMRIASSLNGRLSKLRNSLYSLDSGAPSVAASPLPGKRRNSLSTVGGIFRLHTSPSVTPSPQPLSFCNFHEMENGRLPSTENIGYKSCSTQKLDESFYVAHRNQVLIEEEMERRISHAFHSGSVSTERSESLQEEDLIPTKEFDTNDLKPA